MKPARGKILKPLKTFLVICLWRPRLFGRYLRFDFLASLQGKVAALMLPFVILVFIKMFGSGAENVSTAGGLRGSLLMGHLFITALCAATAPMFFAKYFVLEAFPEPLLAHPFCLRELAAARFVFPALLTTAMYLPLYFYMFFLSPLTEALTPAALVFHPILLSMHLFVTLTATAPLVRKFLSTPHARARAALVQGAGVLPMLLLLALTPSALVFQERSSRFLETIGSSADAFYWWFQLPLAAACTWSEGRYGAAAGWMAALLVLASASGLLLRRWAWKCGPREIILDLGSDTPRRFPNAFAPGPFSRLFAKIPLLRAFAVKDILLPYSHSFFRYLHRNIILVSTVGFVFAMGKSIGTRPSSSSVTGPVTAAAVFAVAALLPMLHCLNALGMEGDRIALFRPILSYGRLFSVKALSNFVHCLLHSLAYGLLISLVGRTIGSGPLPPALWIAPALVGSLLFVSMGMALGFLLPDMKRSSAFLPGASTPAKCLYFAGSLLSAGYYLFLLALFLSGRFTAAPLALSGCLFAAVVLTCCGLSSTWAIKRLGAMEV